MEYVKKDCSTCIFSGRTDSNAVCKECLSGVNCYLPDGNKKEVLFDILPPDQQAKSDYGKAKLSLVPRRIIWNIAAIREFGTEKYKDPDNWKQVEPERYRDAAYRHFLAYLDDPKSVDKESGMPHLWHLACNIAFLCEMEDPGWAN